MIILFLPLTSSNTFAKLIRTEAALGNKAYSVTEMLTDLQQGIWSEVYTNKPIDVYRRNLQKAYIEKLGSIVRPAASSSGSTFFLFSTGPAFDNKKSDVLSILKGTLRSLRSDINAALPSMHDKLTRYHLQDVSDRINMILEPK